MLLAAPQLAGKLTGMCDCAQFLIVLYVAGLGFLVRQFRLEREARRESALKDTPELKPIQNGNEGQQMA